MPVICNCNSFFFFDLSAVDADALDAYAITLNSDHNMCSCCILCILYVIGISNGVALGHCKSSRACRPLAFQIASHCLLGRIAVWHCVERGWNVWHCSLALQFDEDDVYDDLEVLALKDWRAWNVDMLKRQNG